MTRRPTRTLRTRRHVQCTLPSFLRIVWRRYMRPHNHLRAEKDIPKVGTTCANRHHAPSNPLIGLARHHAKSQKPAPNCSSWASKRPRADQLALEWMRAVLQKDISLQTVHDAVDDPHDLKRLLHFHYEGRLSERNRSMVILASRHGVRSGIVCQFLGITKKTHRRYDRKSEE